MTLDRENERYLEPFNSKYIGILTIVGVIVYPLCAIMDHRLLPQNIAADFLFIRVFQALVTLLFYIMYKLGIYRRAVVFNYVVYGGMSLQLSYLCSISPSEHSPVYFSALSAAILAGNGLIVWDSKHSAVINILCFLIFTLGIHFFHEMTWADVIDNGYPMTLVLSILSVFMMKSRHNGIINELKTKKSLNLANEKLQEKQQEVENQSEELKIQLELTHHQNQELSKLYENITSSVRYALRIQQAFLPDVQLLDNYYQKHRIIYQPKDIVSGDFYWWKEKNGYFYTAIVDCTGHGVPASFLTIIAKVLLDTIVDKAETEITPAEIFEQLQKEFRAAISVKGNKFHIEDGMELSLVRYHKPTGELIFSGARRPLWLLKNSELIELKGTKKTIGGIDYHKDLCFEDQSVVLEKGNILFMFTDGITDQFGGPRDKKILQKRIRNLILEDHNENFENHLDAIVQSWLGWKGDTPQTDDVLALAVEV
ncbi:PP2C family protein-serine/threonine phosphatase [Sediminitomix flava]|uniref:Serine phosphatase RsbU (Regulator of sigma subunit) n=1 Tax=Sediminitomix flava TaxID=379075 RepID=A0A315ZHU3_SEDFL|nr:SpoIIE family protein phosphatase [Sediminitomix flava]PWJ44388.1 serine phosphatase RsbU (regulator of sigma subunit) [Sediminitomix flava]